MGESDVTLRPAQPGQGVNDVILFVLGAVPIFATDSGLGQESLVPVGIVTSDLGSGLETCQIMISVLVADVGAGLDIFSKQFQAFDVGSLCDRFAIRVLQKGRLRYTVRLSVKENVFDPTVFDPNVYE